MDSHKFLSTVLPDNGWYCLLALLDKNKDGRADVVQQKLFDSVDSIIERADHFDKQGFDTYFASSAFITDENRTADNVLSTKMFYMDIDCGQKYVDKNTGYIDQKTALQALLDFCEKTGVPVPTIMDSGRGLHVYWPLTEAIPPCEWQPVAAHFKALTLKEGLLCDQSVTADSAQVLRIPQMHNHKDNPPKEVNLLTPLDLFDFNDFAAILGEAIPVPKVVPSRALAVGMSALDKLAGYDENYDNSFKVIMQKTLDDKGCAQLLNIVTDQENIDEPLWRAGLSIAKFCHDGEQAAHKMSDQHPDYDEAATNKKLDGIEGPHTCETFNGLCPNICEDCPNFGKVKSPIVLGKEFVAALPAPESDTDNKLVTTVRPKCPYPFSWGKNGPGVYKQIIDKDGEETIQCIVDHDFYLLDRVNDERGDGECAVFELALPHDGFKEFTVPLIQLQTTADMRKSLARYGVVSTYGWKHIEEYVNSSLVNHQLTKKAVPVKRQFGWTKDHEGFVIGNKEYRKGGNTVRNHPSPPTKDFFPAFEKKGTLEGWKYMAECYNEKGLELRQVMMCIGLGSPLMEMIDGIACCGYHMYSKDGGLGKTSALNAQLTPWGEPSKLRTKNRDTQNFRMNRAEVYKNLPLSIDEMTNVDPLEMSEVVYDVSAGSQRGRMSSKSNQERQTGDEWSLLSITTANVSMLDQIALGKGNPNAESQRIMEFFFERVAWSADSAAFDQALMNNYGHAGPIVIQYALDNYDAVQERLLKKRKYVINLYNLTDENRFWSAGLAIILLMGEIANELGLFAYDLKGMEAYLAKAVKLNQQNIEDQTQSSEQMVSGFVMKYQGNILSVRGDEDVRKKTPFTGEFNEVPKIYGAIMGRYESNTHQLSLDHAAFKQHLTSNQAGDKATLNAIIKDMNGQVINKFTLTRGVDITPIRTKVIVFHNYRYDDD